MYFLDSNICIYFLKGLYPALNKKLLATPSDSIKIPAIVEAEIRVGIEKNAGQTLRQIWEKFFAPFEIIPFDHAATKHYGSIRALLEKKGEIIGPNDFIIAATVLAYNGILVTHNTREFARIPNLILADWT